MSGIQSDFVRIENLLLQNDVVFPGPTEIKFNRHRTIIVGANGTGKTTIFNALASLGPAMAIKNIFPTARPEASVEVTTRGNRALIGEYSSIIFFGGDSIQTGIDYRQARIEDIPNHPDPGKAREEARSIFHAFLSRKPWKMKPHHDLDPQNMAVGERVCLVYAFALAIRRVLRLDLPVVFDSPYGLLDMELRQGVIAFLREQPYQQILLGSEEELREEETPHYLLENLGGYSRVRNLSEE